MKKIPDLIEEDRPDCFGDKGFEECMGCWIAVRVLRTTSKENLRMTIQGVSYGRQRTFISKCNKVWHKKVKEDYGSVVCEEVAKRLAMFAMDREMEQDICLN